MHILDLFSQEIQMYDDQMALIRQLRRGRDITAESAAGKIAELKQRKSAVLSLGAKLSRVTEPVGLSPERSE